MPRLLTSQQLAAELGYSACTVQAWAKRGEIPSIRHGARGRLRFDLEDVVAALKTPKQTPYTTVVTPRDAAADEFFARLRAEDRLRRRNAKGARQ